MSSFAIKTTFTSFYRCYIIEKYRYIVGAMITGIIYDKCTYCSWVIKFQNCKFSWKNADSAKKSGKSQ